MFITEQILRSVAAENGILLLGHTTFVGIKSAVMADPKIAKLVFEKANLDWAHERLAQLIDSGSLFVPKGDNLSAFFGKVKALKGVIKDANKDPDPTVPKFIWSESDSGFSVGVRSK
jgi:hypothetical protein